MSQVFLFTGENRFALQEEKMRWIHEFKAKHGEENFLNIDKKPFTFSEVCDEIATAPFIAERRLVVVEGIPKIEKEQWESMMECIHPSTILLICEPKPDKRLSIAKLILASCEVKEFLKLPHVKLKEWVQRLGAVTPDIAEYLISVVGTDQMLLHSEIGKLRTYGGAIDKEAIDTLVMLSSEQAVWLLMDLLAAEDANKALSFTRQVLLKGENAHALWSRLLWMLSQFVLVCSAVWDGHTSPPAVAKAAGVSFPSAKTLIPLARKTDPVRLSRIVTLFAQYEKALKTGGFRATIEAPEELEAVLDTCISSFVRS